MTDRHGIIINTFCSVFGVAREELLSSSRTKHVAPARQATMWGLRYIEDLSLESIGAILDRNHSTVTYGIEKAGEWSGELKRKRDTARSLAEQRIASIAQPSDADFRIRVTRLDQQVTDLLDRVAILERNHACERSGS